MPYSTPTLSGQGDGLPQREVDIINHVVRDFLTTRKSNPELELEDLTQECVIHWWTQRPKYDAERGASIETFLRRVVNSKLLDLERGLKAQKRGGGRIEFSLDHPLFEDEPDSETLADTFADPVDTARESVEKVSLEVARSRLSPRQKQIIAGLIEGRAKSQISQSLGVPRTTLYDDLKRIRQIFRDEGLAPFFDESDT